jgi:hypothetical protein
MRIFISGPISGTSDATIRFEEAQKELEKKQPFDLVINPEKVMRPIADQRGKAARFSHEEYMALSFTLLECCDAVYMLRDWEESQGACEEYGFAKGQGMDILFQSKGEKTEVDNG